MLFMANEGVLYGFQIMNVWSKKKVEGAVGKVGKGVKASKK